MSRYLLLAAFTLGSATASAVDITEINGVTLTNGIGTITNNSALGLANNSFGISAITDNNLTTGILNMGSSVPGSSFEAGFSGPISSSANAVFFIQPVLAGPLVPSGNINLQLLLIGGALTNALNYGNSDYTGTSQQMPRNQAYFVFPGDGSVLQTLEELNNIGFTSDTLFGYLEVPFSDFGVSQGQVVGIKINSFARAWPDFTYIGLGYSGAPPIPEPSTYGLILGGLALAGAAMRRRKKA